MKERNLTKKVSMHRIIMPVYIPNDQGYFENGIEVLKLSIDTLLQTIHNGTTVTIINNDCSIEVSSYLHSLLTEKKIDQLIINAVNIGKVDPLVSIMKGSLEPLITIADADVLFKQGWQEKVEEIFFAIPNVGMVSPLPQPANFKYYASWSWYFGLTRKCFTLTNNEDLDAVKKFKESTNNFTDFTSIEKMPLGLNYNGIKVVIGAGHFCATFNREVIKYIPDHSSGYKFDGAEAPFLDRPVEDAGLLRLATNKGWIYHIGNKSEPWMYDILHQNGNCTYAFDEGKYKLLTKGFLYRPQFLNSILKKIINSTRVKNLAFKMAKKS